MISPIHRQLCVGCLLAVLSSLVPLSQIRAEEPPTPEQVLREYRTALEVLEARHSQIQIEGGCYTAGLVVPGTQPPPKHKILISYVLSDGCEKYNLIRDDDGKYLDRVLVTAGDRRFGLRRTSPGATYYLEQETFGGSAIELLKDRRGFIAGCEFCVGGRVDWPSMVQSSAFRVTAVTREAAGERTLYRIEFRYSEPTREHDGWFRVDPYAGWSLQDYLVRTQALYKSPASRPPTTARVLTTISGSITYRGDGGSIVPSIISHHRIVEAPNRAIDLDEEFRATKWVLAPTPREEFTLAYYGLGDFEKPGAQRGSRAAYWVAGLGVACLLISAILAGIVRFRGKARS